MKSSSVLTYICLTFAVCTSVQGLQILSIEDFNQERKENKIFPLTQIECPDSKDWIRVKATGDQITDYCVRTQELNCASKADYVGCTSCRADYFRKVREMKFQTGFTYKFTNITACISYLLVLPFIVIGTFVIILCVYCCVKQKCCKKKSAIINNGNYSAQPNDPNYSSFHAGDIQYDYASVKPQTVNTHPLQSQDSRPEQLQN